MSVATKNPFALLDAEGDSRPTSPAPAPAAQASAVPPAPARTSQKTRGGPASRGGKYYSRGGGNKSVAKDSAATQNGAEEPPVENQRKVEGRGRGRGSRGGPGRGGRRPFDRHSQTGKTDSEKKIQQSWGGADGNTELKQEEAATVDAAAEEATAWGVEASNAGEWETSAPTGDAQPAAEGEKVEGRPRKEKEEEEDNTLTLDQYLAKQKEKESIIPKLEGIRQANEGAGGDIWKDAVPIQKDDENAYFVGKTKTAPKARAKKEEKIFIEIDARFERPDRGRGRGGRGGDRGRGRGRGGPRGGRQATNAPVVNVDDEVAFPSLS